MRNRFISEHIYRKTGKRRTAKQVGSRLQQLRDTCGGKRLLNLLSPYRRPPPRPRWPDSSAQYDVPPLRQDTESSSEASSSTPTTPVDSHRRLDNGYDCNLSTIPETVVYIDLLPDGCTSPEVHSDANPSGSIGPMDQQSTFANGSVVHASDSPRHFSSIDPTITFMAPSTLSARSLYTVYMHGTSVFSEATALSPVGPPPGGSQGALLYSTSLVPGFWDILSKTPDPTQYIIVQHVVQDTPSPTSLAFSAVYKFRYPTKPLRMSDRIPSPITHMEPVTHTNVDYNDFNSLLAMEYEFPSFEPKNEWGYCSPHSSDRELSSYSRTSRSPSSEHDEDSDSLLSPSTACFPMDLSNYVL
ncbi:hypothetical protein BD779DRAFT_883119 [Infundibulicybe gibba]|nr:hypothetical protein BD779DRAFT_883119 [Infundibulicybe gibba]